jgi:hypothetical protein
MTILLDDGSTTRIFKHLPWKTCLRRGHLVRVAPAVESSTDFLRTLVLPVPYEAARPEFVPSSSVKRIFEIKDSTAVYVLHCYVLHQTVGIPLFKSPERGD